MGKAIMDATPAPQGAIRFTVGRDAAGCWVVQDRDGRVGGFFRDCASAVHFAMFESDHRPGAVCCLPDGVIDTPSLAPAKSFCVSESARQDRVVTLQPSAARPGQSPAAPSVDRPRASDAPAA